VVLCDGEKGSHATIAADEILAHTRRQELETAAKLLGVREVHALGYPDGEVTNSLELRSRLVALVRRLKPDIVIGPDPTATFFGGVYVNHRDHRETGWALLDAVAPAAAMPLYFPEAGPAHQVATLLLSGTHEPDVAIGIESNLNQKVAAVLAHRSQMGGDDEGISEVVRSRAAQAGRPVGIAFAEAFRCVELDG
jgi:LmbE family N-acetylglucosaminyl deacetylase